MGTAGSDVALETADVALMADDLTKLTEALRIGKRTRKIVRQNLVLSIAILAVLVPGALFGAFTLPVAVLAHELSELVVISNGMRLARR
jgi:Cd2+/Zn2+-exporting ATPase